MLNKSKMMEALPHLKTLRGFIGNEQLLAVGHGCRGEEQDFFYDKLKEMAQIVEAMPKTYETDGQGEAAIVRLHYFTGGMDWYITEKDSDPDGAGQVQAFGLADLGYGGELGYISLAEILEHGAELDFHFRPRALAEVMQKHAA